MIYTFASILLRTPLQSLKDAYNFSGPVSPLFDEGIYLSSEDLRAGFAKKDTLQVKGQQKLELSFAKYHIRSASRCTPYGTFAGSAVVHLSDGPTALQLGDPENHIRKIRVDMNYLTEIINAILADPLIFKNIKLYPNNSIYELAQSYRYATYTIRNNSRFYELTSVEKTPYLASVLLHAAKGVSFSELTLYVSEKQDVKLEEAALYLTDLCDAQILVSELEPSVTGPEPLAGLISKLRSNGYAPFILKGLEDLQQTIDGDMCGVEHYRKIENQLKNLPLPVQVPKNTLQTDLFLSMTSKKVSREIIETVVSQHQDLYVLAKNNSNKNLDGFKSAFLKRYEHEEVPLLAALDVETGVGYAGNDQSVTGQHPIIQNLLQAAGTGRQLHQFDIIQRYVHAKYHDFLENKKESIVLTEDELTSLQTKEHQNLPDSFYLFGSILGGRTNDDFTFDLITCSGPSAANFLARFTHGDNELRELTREILKEEQSQYPGAIYAEFAHFPQARIGNVLLRPLLRDYEIPYVGISGADADKQIGVGDLLVSIRDNEIYLRSKKHNRRIIPRLTTAHNYSHRALPLYQFLGDLQRQGLVQTNFWDWGVLAALPHLPRVTYKNLIISKARWKLDRSSIKDLPTDEAELPAFFNQLRERSGIPVRVSSVEGDNKLLLDLSTRTGTELFLHYLKRQGSLTLEEFLFTEENAVVSDEQGKPFANEFVIPLYRRNPVIEKKIRQDTQDLNLKRKFSPYSEWIYYKLYCGPAIAERLLREELLDFVERGMEDKLFEKFFFIRYRDESTHLRLRFYNTDISRQLKVHQQFMSVIQPLLDNGLAEKIVVDTYSREIERYGGDLMETSEDIFHHDSLAVMRFARLLGGPENEKYRLLFGLRGADRLLDDFGLKLPEKKALITSVYKGFFKEFGGTTHLEKQLNDRFRKQQREIFSHMDPVNDEPNGISEAVEVFNIRSDSVRSLAVLAAGRLNSDPEKLQSLLLSYLHMFINRLFINNQRKYELVIYHFLERYYTSATAIERKKAGHKTEATA